MKNPVMQQTFVLVKPSVFKRALLGRIFQRFDDADLKFDTIKSLLSTPHQADLHYSYDLERVKRVGNKVIIEFEKEGLDYKKYLSVEHAETLGKRVLKDSVKVISNVQVLACVISGPHAIERVKQIIGTTNPLEADRGTIRGDFCTDSVINSNIEHRSIDNLVHRSSCVADVKREISIWLS